MKLRFFSPASFGQNEAQNETNGTKEPASGDKVFPIQCCSYRVHNLCLQSQSTILLCRLRKACPVTNLTLIDSFCCNLAILLPSVYKYFVCLYLGFSWLRSVSLSHSWIHDWIGHSLITFIKLAIYVLTSK